jgi:hypothetical protein
VKARTVVAGASLALVFGAGFSAVRSTNFGGYDEWLMVSLTERGIFDFPYANRPLAGLWAAPGALGLPATLDGYLVVQAAWLLLAGLVLVAIVRRLEPGAPRLAVMAGAFGATWAPLDPHRLNPLNNLPYSGAALAALLALLLLAAWATGEGRLFLAGAAAFALVAARSHEAATGLVGPGGLLFLLALGRGRRVAAGVAHGVWVGLLAVLAAAVALPLAWSAGGSYQLSGLRLSLDPAGVLARVAQQLRWHLGPLLAAPPLWSIRLGIAASAMAAAVAACPAGDDVPRRRLAQLAAAGLGLGVAGWAPLLLTPSTVAPAKMQGFSAPGFGLMLASAVLFIVSLLPRRARLPATLALSGWLVALGTAHTLALQREWDERSAYPAQQRLLESLVSLAPDLREGTLVVLAGGQETFPATFTFHHAVSSLYAGRAAGLVHGGHDFLYPARFEERGIAWLPWPVVRKVWREPARLFGYDAVVVVRSSVSGLTLEDRWPADLPAVRGSPAYEPLARIVRSRRQARVPSGGRWKLP